MLAVGSSGLACFVIALPTSCPARSDAWSCLHACHHPQAKAIQRLIVTLCSELRGVALGLVSAFGVPDHILRAPIGLAAHTGVDMYKEYLMAVGFDV